MTTSTDVRADDLAALDFEPTIDCENPAPGHTAPAEYLITFHCEPCNDHPQIFACRPCTVEYLSHAALRHYIHDDCGRHVTAKGEAL